MRKEKRLLVLGLLVAALATLSIFALSQRLEVSEYVLTSPKLNRAVTLAVATDLHNSFFGENQGELVAAIRAAEPDALLMVGDMANSLAETDGVRALAKGVDGICPIYYVTGNHECMTDDLDEILRLLRSLGVNVLEGESSMLACGIRVAGTDDPLRLTREDWKKQLDACRSRDGVYTVLMAHRPDRAEAYETGFDLVVSGHAHGGQARIPGLIDGLWAPNQGWFPKYCSGLYAVGDATMAVSRGLCKNALPRVFNRPELMILRIAPDGNDA